LTDSAYLGIQKIHAKALMPKKKSKKYPLSKEDKKRNAKLSSERVINENIYWIIEAFQNYCRSI